MAYDKAKEVTVKNKLFFIEDIVAFLPCDKTSLFSFYILKTIKRFSLNYDIILHNKNNSAFILSNEL